MHIHVSRDEKLKLLMKAVLDATMVRSPQMVLEWQGAIKESYEAQWHPSGKLRAEVNGEGDMGYISVRFPQELFFMMRKFMPTFGDDDRDLRIIAEEFPGICSHQKAGKRKKSDDGPKKGYKRIYTDAKPDAK